MAGLYRRPNLYAFTVLHDHGAKEVLIAQSVGVKYLISEIKEELLKIYGHTRYTLEYKKVPYSVAQELLDNGADDWRK